MRTGILILILLGFSNSLYAEVLDGSFTETGSGNTYSVNIQTDEGHVYTGTASLLGDGTNTMLVSVTDGEGETYSGYAQHNEVDNFDLYLKNPQTGLMTTGTADVDEF